MAHDTRGGSIVAPRVARGFRDSRDACISLLFCTEIVDYSQSKVADEEHFFDSRPEIKPCHDKTTLRDAFKQIFLTLTSQIISILTKFCDIISRGDTL